MTEGDLVKNAPGIMREFKQDFLISKMSETFKDFLSKYTEKEDKAVMQAIAKVMKDGDIAKDPSRLSMEFERELQKSPDISPMRIKKEVEKLAIGNNVRNSSAAPMNKDRRENLKEKLNRVSKEENSSPKRAAVSQDLQHNPLHR